MRRLERAIELDPASQDDPRFVLVSKPCDEQGSYLQAAALRQLLTDHLDLPVTLAGLARRRPVGYAIFCGPAKSLESGWFEFGAVVSTLAPEVLGAGEPGRALASQLPMRIRVQARLAREAGLEQPAAVWRLSDEQHPLIRPSRTHGVVSSSGRFERVALVVAPLLPLASDVAESGTRDATRACAAERVRQAKHRHATISCTFVESRSRWKFRPQGWLVPMLSIKAKWLALCGFDIGQRVQLEVEPGRLVIAPEPAAGANAPPADP